MSAFDEESNSTFHDVGGGNYLKCDYHNKQWEGVRTKEKRRNAKAFFLQLSPYSAGKPTENAAHMTSEMNHTSDIYCGGKKYIMQSIVYEKCPNRPRNFTSPYNYHTIGPSSLCFLKGRSIGGGGGAQGGGGGGHGGGGGGQGGGGGGAQGGGGGGGGGQGGGGGGQGGGGGGGQGGGGGGGQGGGGGGAQGGGGGGAQGGGGGGGQGGGGGGGQGGGGGGGQDGGGGDIGGGGGGDEGGGGGLPDNQEAPPQPPQRNRRNRAQQQPENGVERRQSQRLRNQQNALQHAPVRARVRSPPQRNVSGGRKQGGGGGGHGRRENSRNSNIKHRLRKTERKNYKFGSNESHKIELDQKLSQSTVTPTQPTQPKPTTPTQPTPSTKTLPPPTQPPSTPTPSTPSTPTQPKPTPSTQTQPKPTPMPTPTPTPTQPLSPAIFNLQNETLPKISEPISTQVMQWDQNIQLGDMKNEWQQLLQTIREKIQSQVYRPLQKFNIEKIISGDVAVKNSDNNGQSSPINLECVKQTELFVRAWMEKHRRRLFFKNGLNDRDGFVEYTRAAFFESLESIIHTFQEEWTMKLDKCLRDTKDHLKTNAVLKKRTIKPPMDTSEQQSQLAKIMNIRGDPELLTQVQSKIYDACIHQLTRELKSGVPFAQIQIQMNSVPTVDPYLKRMWDETVKFYKSLQIQPLLQQTLDRLYDKIKPTWAALPVIFELIQVMDHSFRINQWSSFFTNLPVTSLRHQYIFETMKATLELFASHQIALEKYIEIQFPQILHTWAQEDMQSITSDEHLTKITNQFQQLYEVYISKFGNDLNNPENLSWLSRSLVIIQQNDVLML